MVDLENFINDDLPEFQLDFINRFGIIRYYSETFGEFAEFDQILRSIECLIQNDQTFLMQLTYA